MNSPVVSAQVAQSFAFIKGLAGILCEAYEFIQFGFFADNRVPLNRRNYKKYKVRKKVIQKFKMVDLTSKFFPSMSADDLRAIKEVEDYFSKPNLMRRLRNKFAFHYDFHEALEHLNKFSGIEDPHLFLEESSANCCYVSANQWLILQALQVNPNDPSRLKEKFDILMGDAVTQAGNLATFLHAYVLAFSKEYLSLDLSKSKEIKLENVMFWDEITLPFFSKKLPDVAHAESK